MPPTPATSPTARSARIWAALGIVYVVWGSTYFAIRIAIQTLQGTKTVERRLRGEEREALVRTQLEEDLARLLRGLPDAPEPMVLTEGTRQTLQCTVLADPGPEQAMGEEPGPAVAISQT